MGRHLATGGESDLMHGATSHD